MAAIVLAVVEGLLTIVLSPALARACFLDHDCRAGVQATRPVREAIGEEP